MKSELYVLARFFLICLLPSTLTGAEREEHRNIARHSLKLVLEEYKTDDLHAFLTGMFVHNSAFSYDQDIWDDKSFDEISAEYSGKDLSFARCQEAGKTILEQLRSCPANLVEEVWDVRKPSIKILSAEQTKKNAIVNYLLHHLVALRFADRAGMNAQSQDLHLAFAYEAIAISYLTDAFSSGHLMLSLNRFLAKVQRCNYQNAHDSFSRRGLYVINSRGQAWQAFGDKIMEWYGPTFKHVLEACTTSLKELLLVFYLAVNSDDLPAHLKNWAEAMVESAAEPGDPVKTISQMASGWLGTHSGVEYYESIKQPTLMLLPMPVAATWSLTTDKTDELGIHARRHYPQLQDTGYHDPTLAKSSIEFQPFKKNIPSWLVPAPLRGNPPATTPAKLIRDNPEIASVRFIQDKEVLPTFKGFLIHSGGGVSTETANDLHLMAGLGYSLVDDLFLINNVSLDITFQQNLDTADSRWLTITAGSGLKLPKSLRVVSAIRAEAGYAAGLSNRLKKYGYKVTIGLELPVLPFGFTYAGLTTRFMFQRVDVGPSLDGAYLQLVMQ